MISNPKEWTIVIVGSWNVSIFTPTWIAKILEIEAKDIKTEGVISPLISSFKFQNKGTVIVPSADRLVCGSLSGKREELVDAESTSIKFLEKLSETPINGVGVNFGFNLGEDEDLSKILSAFEINDGISKSGIEVIRKTVDRQIKLDGKTVNLTLTQNDQSTTLKFNFHFNASEVSEAINFLDNKTAVYLDEALELARSVYSLTFND